MVYEDEKNVVVADVIDGDGGGASLSGDGGVDFDNAFLSIVARFGAFILRVLASAVAKARVWPLVVEEGKGPMQLLKVFNHNSGWSREFQRLTRSIRSG
ncbi:hypothetical protein PoB_000602300 [Plakobranchus ocellatus]|uniref:Uncharacterized protein n=1 Tax=Plakobranchus ocellatus TaxID=259542 RepID=A0AAV3YAH7_9GAST|nr:hypothetical protein PoB_000602300 [Plakobranchus ocellatus]